MIEIPKGSRNKYEYDKKLKVIKFDRMLFSAMHYPSDYGFIPKTLARDGDPLDALVLVWEPTFPGCHIETNPSGSLRCGTRRGRTKNPLRPGERPLMESHNKPEGRPASSFERDRALLLGL